MFLALLRLSRRHVLLKCLIRALLLAQVTLAVEPPPPCILEVPVYGPFGDRLPFKVTGLAFEEGGRKVDLLGRQIDGIAFTSKGDRVFFSSDRIVGARPINVTLEGPNGARITSEMIVSGCRARRSLFFGQSDLGDDVNSVPIKGRLSGCQFVGDWWVRAMPMFGGQLGTAVEDGYVGSNGSFWLSLGTTGVRHLLVIGKGRDPVKVIGVDITVGKQHDLGTVDLTGDCPK
jgi:hypothetical protein